MQGSDLFIVIVIVYSYSYRSDVTGP
jgi:hypothetical protein